VKKRFTASADPKGAGILVRLPFDPDEGARRIAETVKLLKAGVKQRG
jgi:hypothetical protein